MKTFAVLTVLWSFTFASVSMAETTPSNDELAVRTVVHGFEDAWNHHDMDALASLFAADADFVNVIGIRWIGREAIKQAHAATHATIFKNSALSIGDTTIRFLTPDIAIARSLWSLTGQTERNGKVGPKRTGILTHVIVKTAGHWLIVMSQNTDVVNPVD
jgi:uncharacterized protein (TIGR02246 family)